jgi:uncharacterized membrane protein YjgN (DUF898 family)
MQATMRFTGTGKELLGRLIGGVLLTVITAGIYGPWFLVGLYKYVLNHTEVRDAADRELKLDCTGTGGQLFVTCLTGSLLMVVTLGIYAPWFATRLGSLLLSSTQAKAPDGTTYTGRLTTTGGQTFMALLVANFLTSLTFGIYLPWMLCKTWRHFARATEILANGEAVGDLDFTGQGGPLFKLLFGGMLLSLITLGIYLPWFQVKQWVFFNTNTKLTIGSKTYAGDFQGAGKDYFVMLLVGGILTTITLGIYGAWELANLLSFRINNSRFQLENANLPKQPQLA